MWERLSSRDLLFRSISERGWHRLRLDESKCRCHNLETRSMS